MMKEETRYRVTGTLFLLALAAIFLPMILDGEGLPTIEQPPIEFAAPNQRPEAAKQENQERDATADRVVAAPSANIVPIEPDAALAATVQALETEIDSEGFERQSGTRLGEPVLATPSSEPRLDEENRPTGTWAVQVAAFGKRGNAEELRQRLREDGFEAFLSTEQRANGTMTRVAIGPFQSRDDATKVRDVVSKRYAVSARLMAFSL
ncbi:MAG: SPOR domain-containing protein [Pseudomonadales bacterium]